MINTKNIKLHWLTTYEVNEFKQGLITLEEYREIRFQAYKRGFTSGAVLMAVIYIIRIAFA